MPKNLQEKRQLEQLSKKSAIKNFFTPLLQSNVIKKEDFKIKSKKRKNEIIFKDFDPQRRQDLLARWLLFQSENVLDTMKRDNTIFQQIKNGAKKYMVTILTIGNNVSFKEIRIS